MFSPREDELATLTAPEKAGRIREAGEILRSQGAHYLVESTAEMPPVLDEIEIRLALGERP